MKNNILKNIDLDSGEKIYKDFRKLNAKGYTCQILLTTKRLIIFSRGFGIGRGKKTKQKRMNEIDINSIRRLEYYIEYLKNNIWVRLIGFILLVIAIAAGYFIYMGKVAIPASIPFQPYSKYGAVALLVFIGILMLFKIRKTLYLNITSGASDKTVLKFDVRKYNELAIRYLASRIRPQ